MNKFHIVGVLVLLTAISYISYTHGHRRGVESVPMTEIEKAAVLICHNSGDKVSLVNWYLWDLPKLYTSGIFVLPHESEPCRSLQKYKS